MTPHPSLNALIRQAARGQTNTPPDAVGDLGVGRGGAAGGAPRPSGNTEINARIRRAVQISRTLTVPSGIDPFA
jgi:hypothetical protein